MPSLFYAHEIVLLDEDNNAVSRKFGAMPSGIPTVSICVSPEFAYGSTAAYIDNKDVYYETVRNNSGKMQYRF
jgi:acyl-homoserine lactone acylase PvdQ